MARIMIVLNRDEIQKNLHYSLICMTKESSIWNTMKRKRLWKSNFTDKERESASRIFRYAHIWTLVKGIPDEITMSVTTYDLWQKIANFCCIL